MLGRCRKLISPLAAWYVTGLLWLAQVVLSALMIVFRAVKTAGIAGAIQLDDVPVLLWFDKNYADLYWALLAGGIATAALFVGFTWWGCRLGNPLSAERRTEWGRSGWSAAACATLFVVFVATNLIACFPLIDESGPTAVEPITWVDWLSVVSLAACCWVLPAAIVRTAWGICSVAARCFCLR